MKTTRYTMKTAGYCDCACRDCFDIAISCTGDEVGTVLCGDCKDAGCESAAGECCREPELEDHEEELAFAEVDE